MTDFFKIVCDEKHEPTCWTLVLAPLPLSRLQRDRPRCPRGNADLYCPLEVEDETTLTMSPASLSSLPVLNSTFHIILFEMLIHFNFVTLMGCFDLGWERLRVALRLLCQLGVRYVPALLIPLVLLILGLGIWCVSIKPALCCFLSGNTLWAWEQK